MVDMAETGIAIGIEVIKAVTKHCFDLCIVAKQYPEDVARIHLRLAYILCRVPEWSNQITARSEDPGCPLLVQNLHTALENLTACVEALGYQDPKNWRSKIKLFLSGKSLHAELLQAEALLDQALLELNHDNTSFIAKHVAIITQKFASCNDTEKVSLMVTECKEVGNILSGNSNNRKETLRDIIDAELEECYEEADEDSDDDEDNPDGGGKVNKPKPDRSKMILLQNYEDDMSLLIQKPSSIVFSETCIGMGGFATVYKGTYNGEEVAIKMINIYRNYVDKSKMPDKVYQAEIERVRDEAIVMKECSVHSNIVFVHGYSRITRKGSRPLIVMELMHWSLYSVIHEQHNEDFSFRTQFKLLRDVASALEFLHLQRYVHQDIKPSNILVDEHCTLAKLSDFGVTERKGFNTTWTQRHSTVVTTVLESAGRKLAGTRAYQAPELILGKTTEASRDAEIYSYGVTIWECMSRKIPHYKKEDSIATLARHSTKTMLPFPIKLFLDDENLTLEDRTSFQLLEKIAYLCLSKFRTARPNATQLLQYFDGIRPFNPDFLMVAPLSKWYDKPMVKETNSTNKITNTDKVEHEIVIASQHKKDSPEENLLRSKIDSKPVVYNPPVNAINNNTSTVHTNGTNVTKESTSSGNKKDIAVDTVELVKVPPKEVSKQINTDGSYVIDINVPATKPKEKSHSDIPTYKTSSVNKVKPEMDATAVVPRPAVRNDKNELVVWIQSNWLAIASVGVVIVIIAIVMVVLS